MAPTRRLSYGRSSISETGSRSSDSTVTDVEFKGSLAGGNESQGNLPHLEFENPFDFNLQDNDQILGGDRGAVGASVGADIGVEAAIDVNISIPDTIDAVLKYFDSE
jgi:hypothetical protein